MVAILLGDGFEEMEALCPCDCLRRAGVAVQLVAVRECREVTGAHGITLRADCTLAELPPQLDMLVLPGGMGGVQAILASEAALARVSAQHAAGGWLAAICAAPTVLAALHITDGRRATCFPGMEAQMGQAQMQPGVPVVRDGRLITGTAAGSAMEFSLALVAALCGDAAAAALQRELVYLCYDAQKE